MARAKTKKTRKKADHSLPPIPSTARAHLMAFDVAQVTGWASYADETLVDYGTLKLTPKHDRLNEDYEQFHLLISQCKPDCVVYEEILFRRYVMSSMYTRSRLTLLLLACQNLKIPAFGLTPKGIKEKFAGSGDATKVQMVDQVVKKFGLELTPEEHDIADAIACAEAAILVAEKS